MLQEFISSKIHRATVTDANLNYVGSITIDETLILFGCKKRQVVIEQEEEDESDSALKNTEE